MEKNLEIEFKTSITNEVYNKLVSQYNLSNKIFKQTNFYFDTSSQNLAKLNIILRIRNKGESYKLTTKEKKDIGAEETDKLLTKEEALDILKNGYKISINNQYYEVFKVAELATVRVTMPYKNGVLFFDKSTYYGNEDYEIEYEVDDIITGEKNFYQFLDEHGIEFQHTISKSKRAFKASNQGK